MGIFDDKVKYKLIKKIDGLNSETWTIKSKGKWIEDNWINPDKFGNNFKQHTVGSLELEVYLHKDKYAFYETLIEKGLDKETAGKLKRFLTEVKLKIQIKNWEISIIEVDWKPLKQDN